MNVTGVDVGAVPVFLMVIVKPIGSPALTEPLSAVLKIATAGVVSVKGHVIVLVPETSPTLLPVSSARDGE